MAKISKLFVDCPSCYGHGYWLIPFVKKDGTESKRAKRTTCPRCKGRGAVDAKSIKPSSSKTDDIPF